jgi:hypothetical protein
LIFLHLPKTGGRTLLTLLRQKFAGYRMYEIYPSKFSGNTKLRDSIKEFQQYPVEERSRFRLIAGHMGFGLHHWLTGTYKYFIMFRDPVTRVVSEYHYTRKTRRHYLNRVALKMSLQEFVESGVTTSVDNLYVRLLCTSVALSRKGESLFSDPDVAFGCCTREMFARALIHCRDRHVMLGLTERFEESFGQLQRMYGWSKLAEDYRWSNVGRGYREQPSAAALDAIREHNTLDLELYEIVRRYYHEAIKETA